MSNVASRGISEQRGEALESTPDDARVQLRRLDAYLRLDQQPLLDAATGHSIIATDLNGIVRVFNSGAERMLQYSANEVVGQGTPQFLHGHPTQAKEWTYIRKDGTSLDVSVAVTPILGPNSTISGFLEIATDITQLLNKLQCAQDASRAKSHFLASISHEIRNPLNSILGMVDLLSESDLDAVQRRYVEVFQRCGANLMRLVNDLLDISKIESGRIDLEAIEFDLAELVKQTLQLIGPKAAAKGLSLRSSAASGMRAIGDPVRLQQVLINLLNNAVKFTLAGEIVLSVAPKAGGKAGEFSFSVSDTGIGIAPEKIELIFEDFRQADSSTTRKYGGTGLGLGISRRLITLMGGNLEVRSVPGQGSVFSFNATFAASSL
ncbi:MAG TPA: ATP-binding protein [Bryobacteraceae bacterium]|nr:ATP-binding protein [Bryobacteraceae bacterium]